MFFALAQRRLRSHALHELTDLAADHLHHFQYVVIRLANRRAQKFDDPEDFVTHLDRKGKGAVESFALGDPISTSGFRSPTLDREVRFRGLRTFDPRCRRKSATDDANSPCIRVFAFAYRPAKPCQIPNLSPRR